MSSSVMAQIEHWEATTSRTPSRFMAPGSSTVIGVLDEAVFPIPSCP